MIQIFSSDKTEAKPQTQSFLQMFKEKFSGSLVDLQTLREAQKGKGERSYTKCMHFSLENVVHTHTHTHTHTHLLTKSTQIRREATRQKKGIINY